MFDCSDDIGKFYNEEVRLSGDTKKRLRSNRDANRKRLVKAFSMEGKPSIDEHVPQGSYAMHTINQHPNNDYDIDDGVCFIKDDLVGGRGALLSALDARKLVLDAINDGSFSKEPEARNNCVRVYYAEGHHVDIPVYRKVISRADEHIELASTDWKISKPKEITSWFQDEVSNKSPDSDNGQQLRRIVRLLKKFSKSRASWSLPSGFIITILAVENYRPHENRDDVAFYKTCVAIYNRLTENKVVVNPAIYENVTNSDSDPDVVAFMDQLSQLIDDLDILFDSNKCNKKSALKAWKKIFNHSFFDEQIGKLSTEVKKASLWVAGDEADKPVNKRGGGRFG